MNGVDDRFEPEDTDGDGIPNYLDMDGDNDGIPNSVESGVAANPFAKPVDTDSDGIPDFLDSDSDNDSISDRVEAADNNGNNQSQPVDTDGDNVPDYIDLDSDNDSLLDIAEAGNNSAIRDANQDGLLDNNQAGFITQSPVDSDNDGVDDYRDLTSNGPGNFDINTGVFGFLNNGFGLVSGTEDADGDGIVRDVDADDTVFGSGKLDTDRDGIPDEDDQDADNDGISNTLEGMASLTDTDNDSVPDYRDVDSDNDGLSDLMEGRLYDLATEDFNRDGLLDYDVNNDGRIDANRFVDANNDGIDDNFSVVAISDLVDTDQDGLADFRDIDSDGDRNNGANLTDAAESVASSVPGFIDTIDADGDGALDLINRLTGQPENPLTLIDNDADGVADYKDFTAPVVGSGASVGTEIVTAVDGAGSIALLQMFALFVLTLIKRYKVILLTGMSSVLVFFSSQSQATNICAYFFEFEEQESITSTYDHLMGKKKQGNSEFNSCWYLGAGLGLSFLEPIGTDVNGFTTPDDVTEGTAGHVSIGYRLTEKLFAELKYASLGKVDLTNISTSAKADISYSAISLLAGYYLKDADDKFKPYVKAGISSLDTSASEGVIVRQATSAQFAFGIGAEYRYGSSPWFPRLEIDFYDKDATYASFSFNRFIGGGVEEVVYQEPEPVIAVVEPKPVVLPKEVQKVCDSFNAVIDDINFAFDSAKLNDISIAALLNYARSLKMYPDTKVLVSAHTDSDGDADYNLNLSQKRAESVMQFFIDSGVSSSQLRSKGFGENKPIAPNTTLAGRAANRRVELSILESKTCY